MIRYSASFGQVHCLSSGVFEHCIHTIGIFHASCVCRKHGHPDHACNRQQNEHDKCQLHIYSVEILLMTDSGPVQNMHCISSNETEKLCISLAFIIRTLHGAQSSKCQIFRHTYREFLIVLTNTWPSEYFWPDTDTSLDLCQVSNTLLSIHYPQ